MLNKKVIITTIILTIIIAISAASAAENATEDIVTVDTNNNNEINIDNANNDELEYGTYTELNDAIHNATSGDTIYLNDDFTFTSGYTSSGIKIDKEITIDGNGYTIDAKNNCRIFQITAKNVVLKNIIFKNTYYSTGSAIHWTGLNGTITNCEFINCYSYNTGTIYWAGDNGTITNTYFYNNQATNGGAIYWTGINGTVTNCEFNSNNADANGGAIYWTGKYGTLKNSEFNNNTAPNSGGAIYWVSDEGYLENCEFNNNQAEANGGAVYWASSSGNMENSEFYNNNAQNGGAVYWYGDDSIMTDCVFNDNTATVNGGAVYWLGTDSIMESCEFYDNSAYNYNGGAVYWAGDDGYLDGCIFDSNIAITGGAVYWNGDDGTLIDCIFTNNVVSTEAAAVYWAGHNGNLNDTIFTNNVASNGAGAVYWIGSNGILFNSEFTANNATNYAGALNWEGDDGLISYCDFINNHVFDGNGGAVYKDYAPTVFDNCNFINNTAIYGGAMTIDTHPNDIISNCNFNNNHADYGDAIQWYGFLATITNTRFNGDKTKYDNYFFIDQKLTPTFNIIVNNIILGNKLNLDIDFTSFNESMCGNMDISIINTYTNTIVYNSLQDITGYLHLVIPNLRTGTYMVKVNYTGDNIYNNTVKTKIFEVSGWVSSIDFPVENIKWGSTLILTPTVTNGATGFISIYVDGEYQDTIQVGSKYNLNGLGGPYSDITLVYLGDDNYKASSETKRVYVERLNTTLNVPDDITSGNPSIIEIKLNDDAQGSMHIVFNGEIYKGDVVNGKFTFETEKLSQGNESIIIMYSGDSKYNPFTTSCLVSVSLKIPVIYLNVNNINYGSNAVINAYVAGGNGDFDIYINDEYVTQIPNYSSCTITNPGIGKYDVKAIYTGDSYYGDSENTTAFRVFNFYPIEIENPSIVYNSGRYFNATFYDEYGNPVSNKYVSFRVNGTDYIAKTNNNGTAILNKKFPIGNYTMTIINTIVNEEVTIPLKVYSSISSKDMTRAYNTSADYTVKVFGDDANPLIKGYVIFTVNNQNYTVITDNNGNATLNAHLLPGTYTILTTNALTCETKKNTVKIVSTIGASNTIRGYNSGADFEAKFTTITNQALINQKVIFKVNSTEYELTTNSNGIATLNVKLPVGKYKIEIKNPITNETSIKNLNIVERITQNNNVVSIPGEEAYYTVRVIGNDGQAVGANEIVKITINGATHQIRTDANGYASFKIDQQSMGSNKISAEYKEYTVYNYIYVLQKVYYINNININDINYKENATVTVTFSTFDYNADVEFIITNNNGYKKTVKMLAHETLTLPLTGLNATDYTVTVNYYDLKNFKFSNSTKTFTVHKINPTMNIDVQNANVGENATITVTIPEATGEVTIKIANTIVYDDTIKNGIIVKNINNLENGVYPVYVTYKGNSNYKELTKSATLIIIQNKTTTNILAQNITLQANQTGYLTAVLTDQYGNILIGKNISIFFNGLNQVLTTDSYGAVKLLIQNVSANTYTAVITFAGDEHYLTSTKTAKVTIINPTPKTTLTLKTVKVKRSAKKLVLKATLKIEGESVYKKVIKFKFNKKSYKAKTNKKGLAKVTIKKKVLKKLKAGKKVTYQASYGSITVKKTVKVKK